MAADSTIQQQHSREVAAGERFEFGANWARFLESINETRIEDAARSLSEMLELSSLANLRFLDIGSGSGLFSLAARNLGAEVLSFDYDSASVACTRELKRRFRPDDPAWRIEQGSALDRAYVDSLGNFDIVYSWGVLHHTGAMHQALENAAHAVAPGGRLFIAIYNDQGRTSRRWMAVKRFYNKLPPALRWTVIVPAFIRLRGPMFVRGLLQGRPFAIWKSRERGRGMSAWRDLIDWIGGWPFEVAKPEEIFDFYRARGFRLQKLKTCGGGIGCNEFVFLLPREASGDASQA